MKKVQKFSRVVGAVLVAATGGGALVACGAEVENKTEGEQVTVHNCGIEQKYPKPTKPVAYDVSTIEKMFSLGLADQMRGIVMPKTVKSVIPKSPYKADYDKVETLSDDVLGQETLVNAKADWVFAGWQAGFSPERGITPESLKKIGINSYQQEETCFNYEGGKKENLDPLQAMYRDMDNLGDIFNVKDRSNKLVADLKAREKTLRDKTASAHKPRVFAYDSGLSLIHI